MDWWSAFFFWGGRLGKDNFWAKRKGSSGNKVDVWVKIISGPSARDRQVIKLMLSKNNTYIFLTSIHRNL